MQQCLKPTEVRISRYLDHFPQGIRNGRKAEIGSGEADWYDEDEESEQDSE